MSKLDSWHLNLPKRITLRAQEESQRVWRMKARKTKLFLKSEGQGGKWRYKNRAGSKEQMLNQDERIWASVRSELQNVNLGPANCGSGGGSCSDPGQEGSSKESSNETRQCSTLQPHLCLLEGAHSSGQQQSLRSLTVLTLNIDSATYLLCELAHVTESVCLSFYNVKWGECRTVTRIE